MSCRVSDKKENNPAPNQKYSCTMVRHNFEVGHKDYHPYTHKLCASQSTIVLCKVQCIIVQYLM